MSAQVEPTLAELLRRALDSRIADVHVSMPGIVRSYDAAKQVATVQPAVKRVLLDDDGEQVEEDFPPLQNVPVIWPGGGGFYMHFPLATDDAGLLVFSERSFTEWRSTGLVSAPGDLRLHALHAVFQPGLRADAQARADAPAAGEGVIAVGDGVLRVGSAGAPFVAGADKVDAQLDALKSAINGWTPAPNDGGAALKTALTTLFATWPATVAVEKLRAR